MTVDVSPHDAEEAMRPVLGALFDATDQCVAYTAVDQKPPYDLMLAQLRATNTALDLALNLLGIRR